MMRVLVAAFSLTLLSSAVFAANPAADDDDSLAPSTAPKKVDMRGGQLGNLPASLAGKKVVTVEQLQGAAGAAGKTGTNGNVIVVEQPTQKVGKYLPSTRTANGNFAQEGVITVDQGQKTGKYLPSSRNAGVPGVVEDSLEAGARKNHKNINQRSNEVLGSDNF